MPLILPQLGLSKLKLLSKVKRRRVRSMKLVIRRNQADIKGVLGGHKGVNFTLHYRLVLTEDERSLVDRYKLGTHVLTYRNFQGNEVPGHRVAEVVGGVIEQLPSVDILIGNEKVIRDACESFNALLRVAATFGGEEVVEIGVGRNGQTGK